MMLTFFPIYLRADFFVLLEETRLDARLFEVRGLVDLVDLVDLRLAEGRPQVAFSLAISASRG